MDDSASAGLSQIVETLAPGSAIIAFFFGGAVIALYANKRLGELITPPKAEEYDFTKMLTLSTMVGKDIFLKSYFFYVFFLEFFYVVLCLSRPLVLVLTNNAPENNISDTSWPLSAALLVVGVLPATPFIAQVETALRRLAHSLANIPYDFFNRVTSLSTRDLEDMISNVTEYAPESDLYWNINNLLLILSFPPDDASRIARRFISHRLFGEWTIDGGDIWSPSEFERYKEIFDLLRPKSEALENSLMDLIKSTKNNSLVLAALKHYPHFILKQRPDLALVDEMRRDIDTTVFNIRDNGRQQVESADAAELDLLRERWKRTAHDCEVARRRLIALFSIIARNDKIALRELQSPSIGGDFRRHTLTDIGVNSRHNDVVLKALARLVKTDSPTAEPWYNSILFSGIISFIICVLFLWAYLFAVDLLLPDTTPSSRNYLDRISGSVKESLFLSANTSLEFCFSFAFAGLAALYVRSTRIREGTWTAFDGFRSMPISQYVLLGGTATAAAFAPAIVSYVLYYLSFRPSDFSEQHASALWITLLFKFVFSTIWGFVAVSTCIVVDMTAAGVSRRSILRICLDIIAATILACFLVLVVTPGYDILSRPFWHRMVGLVLVSSAGLIWFSESLRARSVDINDPE